MTRRSSRSWDGYFLLNANFIYLHVIGKLTKRGRFLQVFYFMQPDTTPLKMVRDIAAKLNGHSSNSQLPSEQPKNSENQENSPAQTQPMADTSPTVITSGNRIQVVPLYTPAGSAIKFFCVHPSHRYALSLVPISTGFQGQVSS